MTRPEKCFLHAAGRFAGLHELRARAIVVSHNNGMHVQLETFGHTRAMDTQLLTKLSRHAVHTAQGVAGVARKEFGRELERELYGGILNSVSGGRALASAAVSA